MVSNKNMGGTIRLRTLVLSGLILEVIHTSNEEVDKIYAARYRNLGLTAYGASEEEARKNLSIFTNKFATALHRDGTLASRLSIGGVRSYWEEPGQGWEFVTPNNPTRVDCTERLPVSV